MRTFLAFLILTGAVQAAIPDTHPGALSGEAIELPADDSHGWYLSLFTSRNQTPEEKQFVSWFSTNSQLRSLAHQTHYNVIDPANPNWSRYWDGAENLDGSRRPPLISAVPAVSLHRPLPGGGYAVVAKFQAPSQWFADSDTLARALAACIKADSRAVASTRINDRRPPENCPRCPDPKTPVYNPDPGPVAMPLIPNVEPEIVREEIEAEEKQEHGREVLIAVAVFALTLAFCYVKDRQAQTY